jgi:hypothetical protein
MFMFYHNIHRFNILRECIFGVEKGMRNILPSEATIGNT